MRGRKAPDPRSVKKDHRGEATGPSPGGRRGHNRTGNHRSKWVLRRRLPATLVLVLLVLVVILVGVTVGNGVEGLLGVGAALGAGAVTDRDAQGAERSAAELALRMGSLPSDAVRVHVPVLMYHYVDQTPPPAGPYADDLTVRTGDFEAELDYLVENGYQTVSLAEVYLAMAGSVDLPKKPVVLTFDDGGLDNYQVAFPILKEHGLTGTFFVITGRVGKEGQMDWTQLREMAAQGMSVQSHTASHPDLRGVTATRLEAELAGSRDSLAQAVGEPGYVVCYPSGAYDQRVMDAAKAAGYVMAVATGNGKDLDPRSIFEIKRRRVQAFLPLTSFASLVR